ncbi:hypothetical protein L6164_003023 [Bauhinia variegata]|uniref:Uncharacterized protein n=1 Tax=Bauhinia variegata TaxID=167791 RepID=A0ACB9Q5I2_BAUVA|nr:hypothetical protein L6164_003023 [Bauhinia variegata]
MNSRGSNRRGSGRRGKDFRGSQRKALPNSEKDTDIKFTPQAKVGGDFGFQLIDGKSNFKDMELKEFARELNLYDLGRSYAVVAIMGPQSSGKSTLLNHLFCTKFKEMNDSEGRSQTTQGIWLARCPDIKPLTLVMDIEGTDGSERGEDDTTFEKRSALFALAVADVVLVNLWCHDIGREQAASKPLLRVVFQQSPEQKLEANLRRDIDKIWASIQKPNKSNNIPLSDIFKIEVVFLPNYENRQAEFKLKVKELKGRFVNSTAPGGVADSGEGKEAASGFVISVQNIWKDIMENKDLNLPAHKILVAKTRSEQIGNEVCDIFETSEDWCKLCKDAQYGFVRDFGKKINSILNTCLSKYDAEVSYFDEATAGEKREELVDKLLQLVQPVYEANLKHLRLEHLKKFMEAFDKRSDEQSMFSTIADDCINACLLAFDKDSGDIRIDVAKWDTLKARAKLRQDMDSYITTKRENKVASKIRRLYEPQLKQEISDTVGFLLCEETDPTWSKIRMRLKSITESTIFKLNYTLSEFGVDEEGKKERIESIENFAKEIVEAKAREESGRAKEHMMRKFLKLFRQNDHDWRSKEDIKAAARASIYAPLDVLAGLAAIRLETGDTDNIHQILHSALSGSGNPNTLASHSWPQVPSSHTLITPFQCKQVWQEYMIGAQDAANKALANITKKRPRWVQIVLDLIKSIPMEAFAWAGKRLFRIP